jgi:predicted TPR repeat methyltransferase
MSNENQRTLATYQAQFANYIDGTPQVTNAEEAQGVWIADVLRGVPTDAKIFEIGSAFGRDADFIKSLGYEQVQASDAFDAAVEALQSKGYNAIKFDVLTDEFSTTYDVIFAAAVFLHFTEEDFKTALLKVNKALKVGGRFALSLKEGEGDEWTSAKMDAPRYFRYWTFETVIPVLESFGFKIIDKRRTNIKQEWIQITCVKGDI